MFSDTIHEKMKGWFAKVILGILVLSFALFGVDTYNKSGGGAEWVAKVNDDKILLSEYDEALKRRQSSLREAGQRDNAVLESKELRDQVLDQLMRERLMLRQVVKLGYASHEPTVLATLANDPNFQENGKFSQERFQRFLQANRLSQKQFVALVAQDEAVRELVTYQANTHIASKSVAARMAQALAEQREVAKAVVSADAFMSQVKIEPAQVQAYYDSHAELVQVPEQARVEYVVFSPESVLRRLEVTPEQAKAYYEKNIDQFAQPEEREVSQILIRVAPDAKPEEREAAQKQAQQILQQAQKDPARFAELARQHSQDPISAKQGGALGRVQKGKLFIRELNDAVFVMKAGEIKGPIQSQVGLHIVQVKAVIGGGQRPFEAVKDLVMEGAKRDLAMRKFNEEVEQFGDAVYSQANSLKPAADKYGLTIQTSDWFGRRGPEQGELKNERLLAAIFASDSTANKRNTESIEVAPNTFVAARIAEYRPAAKKPLEAVRDIITERLKREQAAKLAREQGTQYLAQLKQGKDVAALRFGPAKRVDRQEARTAGFEPNEIQAIFRANAKALPAYAGVEVGESGFALYRISAVAQSEALNAQSRQMLPVLAEQALAEQTAAAYVASLKEEASVKIRQEALDKTIQR